MHIRSCAGALARFGTAILCTGCGPGTDPPDPRTQAVVIALDGADWKLIDDRVAAGGMPHLAGLIERGAWGPIETFAEMSLEPGLRPAAATRRHAIPGVAVGPATRAQAHETDRNGFIKPRSSVWWELQDDSLGRLLASIDLDTTAVFVVSDPGSRIDGTPALTGRHPAAEPQGVFLAVGPHIRAGAKVEGASVSDITPTLLYYLGFPVARSPGGSVLADVFVPGFLEEHPVESVPTPRSVVEGGARLPLSNTVATGHISATALLRIDVDPRRR